MHKSTTTDDKKLQGTLKRIGVNTIPAIEEVNIFKDDLVIQFVNPKVQASIAANTWVITGSPQTRSNSLPPQCFLVVNLLKIIGARYYRRSTPIPPADLISPRDTGGHGTHTASTASGSPVPNASMETLGQGTARGAVPSSRIAVYKVCWSDGCYDEDILAAFDDAIADGVDVISISVGATQDSVDYFNDTIAIGAYHAMKKGILTSASAGNDGPTAGTVHYAAPWIMTVGASTTETKYVTKVRLGNGESFVGTSVNTVDLGNKMYPIIYGGNAPNLTGNINGSESKWCFRDTLDTTLVRGKIVLCDALAYVLSHMKPDIAAPGVNILAAWSEATTATGEEGDRRVVPYNILYGTSMACPHVTGAAAYIKSFHPTWSPAAIRSALMTTATPMSPGNNPEAELAYGAGLINLTRCNDPGLVYDAGDQDYIKFLCGQGYTFAQIKLTTGQDDVNCSSVGKTLVWELNYPSFTLSGEAETNVTRVFLRRVTNVGAEVSNYKAMISTSSKELEIKVDPEVLSFSSVGEPKEFRVSVTAMLMNKASGVVLSGVLVWSDGSHQVRSPIVAHTI
ncbi:Subtilisin-like protease SBT4.8 [Linum perenne]